MIDGQKLRRLRITAGHTQESLSAATRDGVVATAVSATYLSNLERGQRSNLRGPRLVALARALGVEPAELLTADEGEAPAS